MIVLDTSALVFWLNGEESLSPTAWRAINAADRRVVSSISIWEIALKVKQGRLLMRLTPSQLAASLSQAAGVEIIAVDAETWVDSVNLDWDHRDPADRIIVALARRFDCPIVSSDRQITAFYEQTVW